jgi:membrane-bound lytic murein transglycosylase B
MPPIRFPLALATLLALAACATPSSEPAAAADLGAPSAAETAPTPPAAEEPVMTCQADKGQWAIGQIADEALVAKVKADTASERVRVIRPGMAVTMDYREDRVNLDVDADNRVTGVRCT